VMDSPVFRRDADGEAMVADQQRRFQVEDGVAAPIRPGVGFLTFARMERAFRSLGLRCHFFRSRGPLAWRMRRATGTPAGRLRGVGGAMILRREERAPAVDARPAPRDGGF
jgi:hypothetical protein